MVTCRIRLPLRAPGEAGTAVPITHAPCTSAPSRGSKKCGVDPVDNVDIGNNLRNLLPFPKSASHRLPFCSPPPNPTKCLNRLHCLPNQRYLARPQPAATRGCPDDRRAGAGPCRRRHWQNRGADRPARPPHRHSQGVAEPDPRCHLHQQGGARDEGAGRRRSSAERSRACPGSVPSIRSRRECSGATPSSSGFKPISRSSIPTISFEF